MLLNDKAIRDLCLGEEYEDWQPTEDGLRMKCIKDRHPCLAPMITPFSEAVSGNGVISYGLSHAGYDLRLGPEILVFKNSFMDAVDPKAFGDLAYRRRMFDRLFYPHGFDLPEDDGHLYTEMNGSTMLIPPHGYILGRSHEYLRIPRHLKGRCTGKSTLARAGIIVNLTPLEPGWSGYLTLEIANATPCPAKIYVGEGICQMELELLIAPPERDYGDKKGQYQGQTGVTPARVKE